MLTQFGMYVTIMFIGFKVLELVDWGWGTVFAPFPAAIIVSGIGATIVGRIWGEKE